MQIIDLYHWTKQESFQLIDEHVQLQSMRQGREEAVDGLDEAEQARLKQERIQRKKAEQEEQKRKYLPLVKFMKSNGLKFKTAAVKKRTIQYFRVDQFKLFLQAKKQKIEKNNQIIELLKNWESVFIYYQRPPNQPHLKWPPQLQPSPNGPSSKFAAFSFDSSESSKYSTALLVFAVIALVLFPLWPYELKYVLWKISLYLLVAFCVIFVLRLVLYMFLGIFGISFWLFPRLMENNVSTLQSFTPLYSISKWQGSSTQTIITKLLLLSVFIYYGYHFYADPDMIKENLSITQTIIDDLDGWGISKIKGEKNFSQSALTDYSKMYNKTLNQGEETQTFQI